MANKIFDHGQLPGSLELAFMGDTIYDLRVRETLVRRGGKVCSMHREASRHVCAHAQSEAFGRIEQMLTEDEANVARRARNAHQHPPKNADPAEYHRATSLEALIGYLYLTGQTSRMNELLDVAVQINH